MRARHLIAIVAGVAALALGAARANAEVRVSGTEDNIRVQTRGATMAEIVAGLESALHTRIELHGSAPQQFTGVYSGPLRRVLSRLLVDVNYVINSGTDGLTIVIVAPNGAPPVRSYGAVRSVERGGPDVEAESARTRAPVPITPKAVEPVPTTAAGTQTGDPWFRAGQDQPAPRKAAPAPAPIPVAPAALAQDTRDPWMR